MRLRINDSQIVWPGAVQKKPEGIMIPTHLKVLTVEEKPFVYVRKLPSAADQQHQRSGSYAGGGGSGTGGANSGGGGGGGGSSGGGGSGGVGGAATPARCDEDEIPCPLFNVTAEGGGE